jgi:uncharacterized protein CbrC (UPF0167 family)
MSLRNALSFRYFQGPVSDMAFFSGIGSCSLCQQEAPCFDLEYAICPELPEGDRQGRAGCITCLSAGRFEFWHDTEIGMLDESGLSKVYNHNHAPPLDFSSDALIDLRRTPQIVTWQQELWLTHCLDFMVYLGTWEPPDFYTRAPDGDGRKLFLQMTHEASHLWDDSLPAGANRLTEWHATYYVFRCHHCGILRGNWDCD